MQFMVLMHHVLNSFDLLWKLILSHKGSFLSEYCCTESTFALLIFFLVNSKQSLNFILINKSVKNRWVAWYKLVSVKQMGIAPGFGCTL